MLENILNEFINHLAYVRNYSPRTLPSYRSMLTKFFELERITVPADITPEKAEHYLAMRKQAGIKQNTNATFMNALRAFLIFCNKKGYARNQLEMYEVPKRERVRVEFLTEDEISRVVAACTRERDRLLMLVMFTSSARVSEIVQMTVENTTGNRFYVIAKGAKPTPYYFDPTVAERLQYYIQMEGITSGPIWRKTNGVPIQAGAIKHIYRMAAKKANINKNVSPHITRRSFATAMYEAGADIYDVKEALGHENVQTTQRYIHYSDRKREQKHAQFAPKVSFPTPVKPPLPYKDLA